MPTTTQINLTSHVAAASLCLFLRALLRAPVSLVRAPMWPLCGASQVDSRLLASTVLLDNDQQARLTCGRAYSPDSALSSFVSLLSPSHLRVHLWARAVTAAGTDDPDTVRLYTYDKVLSTAAGQTRLERNNYASKVAYVAQVDAKYRFELIYPDATLTDEEALLEPELYNNSKLVPCANATPKQITELLISVRLGVFLSASAVLIVAVLFAAYLSINRGETIVKAAS